MAEDLPPSHSVGVLRLPVPGRHVQQRASVPAERAQPPAQRAGHALLHGGFWAFRFQAA